MKMKMFFCWIAMLSAGVSLADHNTVQLDKLILSLPRGWEVRIVRPEGHGGYEIKALLEVAIEFPSVEYEIDTMSGKMKVHPSLWLSFYAPFTEKQYEQYRKKVKEVQERSLQPAAPPLLLAKTENYWIFTTEEGKHFRHPKEKEIYQHVKEFLSINRKQ